ncbi:hypothetical protein [Saccharopolyspora phatthalungensis]|uniref:Uncharacterized protein n=1 Tax=Saccharopolyspora phatthalungensis TaxID=664693 RepID=A0A840QJE3_9PSEU|nr:hypothetical protein [Saccharopolyspora phatthalungensis]MBB5159109.1 hypothetical protein [Saccharopolyspora phatthalungensis]
MLRITIDVFSGRPNPSYELTDAEARDLLQDVARRRDTITGVAEGFDGLGFRGVIVESLTDALADEFGGDLPAKFKVGGGAAADEANGLDIAERLVRGLADHEPAPDSTPVGASLMQYLVDLLREPPGAATGRDARGPGESEPSPRDDTCGIESDKFDPDFWNAADVITKNNCYNYASDWRTDTFAQPGLGAGEVWQSLSCQDVTRAALADGCHRQFDCFPDSEKPRRLVALVMAPDIDYHWYRIHTHEEGFWGHKPGGTAARNVDNSNRLITNPETCDRGMYTQFCGYFYTCLSQRNRIK